MFWFVCGKEWEEMGILRYMKEEFQVIKERDPAIKKSDGSFALSDISCYAKLQKGA